MKKINLNFGMKDGKLVDISEVPSGLNCGCICPSCGSKLVARKGNKRKHHFAHYDVERECEGYLETTLHLAAKEILLRNRKIVLPTYNEKDDYYSDQKKFKYIRVDSEKKIEDIIPDIKLDFGNGNEIFVEIKVTHEVDEVKLEKIKKIDISTLEIDLSKMEFEENILELNELERIIIEDVYFKKWVYDKQDSKNKDKRKKYLDDLRIELERQEKEEKRIKMEREKNKGYYKKYRMGNYYKDSIIGILWKNDNESLGGYILYEEKEYRVIFEEKFSFKKKSPKYIMKHQDEGGMWIEKFGAGAFWEKENGQLNGQISIDLIKYNVSLTPEQEQTKKKPSFYVKLIRKETIRKKQNNTTELPSKKKREITQSDEEIISYFNFCTEGFRLIDNMEYRRHKYTHKNKTEIYLREIRKDISVIEDYIDLINKEDYPDNFQDFNCGFKNLFYCYGKLLEGQYRLIETNHEKYKETIETYKISYDRHRDLYLKNLIITLTKNKVPFQNDGNTIFLDY